MSDGTGRRVFCLGVALMVLCLIGLCGGAAAAVRNFAHFRLDVPEGWNARERMLEDGGGTLVRLEAPGHEAELLFVSGDAGRRSAAELARSAVELSNGRDLRAESFGYSFTYMLAHCRYRSIFLVHGERYYWIAAYGAPHLIRGPVDFWLKTLRTSWRVPGNFGTPSEKAPSVREKDEEILRLITQ